MKRYSKAKIIRIVQTTPQHPDNTDSTLHQTLTAFVVRRLESLGKTVSIKNVIAAIQQGGDDMKLMNERV